MRLLAATLLTAAMAAPSSAQDRAGHQSLPSTRQPQSEADVNAVSPALSGYMSEAIDGDLWQRPQLTPRDRSIVTLAVLIARNQTIDLPLHLRRALDNAVTPREISEIITHLAFYSGLGNANAAVPLAKDAFVERGIGAEQLPPASLQLLPIDEAAEAQRAAIVEKSVGPVSPGLVKFTEDVLFKDLWLRPDLAPRDRSLITVATLIANGQVAQMPFHLNKAMDNGLTLEQAGEVTAHVAFYAGWPNAFSAVPVAAEVLKSRGN
ncbi:carboxymuconolactone decarboxylase family protein [Agaricicola taiwanensis]|nr:carboxymuconolactone decarboxylase family protein [Agaricicola taiwanensis]